MIICLVAWSQLCAMVSFQNLVVPNITNIATANALCLQLFRRRFATFSVKKDGKKKSTSTAI